MAAVRTSLTVDQVPDSLCGVRGAIEAGVAVGFNMHDHRTTRNQAAKSVSSGLDAILAKHPDIVSKSKDKGAWAKQIGTLGGGNHFIEICLDESDRVWVMLHSGSRGIGNQIGRYFIEKAKEQIAELDVRLPDRDLACLTEETGLFADYWEALSWAQDYAARNRQEMMDIVLEALGETLPPFTLDDAVVNCHHNYTQLEKHEAAEVYATRKGAIRAGVGELGIIPGSMGAKSYIVRGKGNKESFCSCSHGAGRRMSQGAAKRQFTREDPIAQTAGVECRKDEGVIDEIPGANKDIDEVMENQSDLVDTVHTLKQILCVKG